MPSDTKVLILDGRPCIYIYIRPANTKSTFNFKKNGVTDNLILRIESSYKVKFR